MALKQILNLYNKGQHVKPVKWQWSPDVHDILFDETYLKHDSPFGSGRWMPMDSLFGLPVKVDPLLAPGTVMLVGSFDTIVIKGVR